MKKLLQFGLIVTSSLIFVTVGFAAVGDINTTVELVSNNTATGELVFDIKAQTNDASTSPGITNFDLKLLFDQELSQAYTAGNYSLSNEYFTTGYTPGVVEGGTAIAKTFQISYFNFSGTTTLDGNLTTIVTVTLSYTPAPGLGTISDGLVYDVYFNGDGGTQHADQLVFTSLTDFPLPVQIASFSANYETGNKVALAWRTESEIETQGFNILRSDAADGAFECITTQMLPAKGNSTDATDYSFTDATVDQNKTYWYQIQEITVKGETAIIAEASVSTIALPTTMALKQNFPNPFNPGTKIHYQLSADSHVTLEIYNILGKKVATLVDKEQVAGNYSIDWNGYADDSQLISSGVYFYQLKANGTSLVKKMTKVE